MCVRCISQQCYPISERPLVERRTGNICIPPKRSFGYSLDYFWDRGVKILLGTLAGGL